MNMDFHYYATHLAARQAGFSQDEAMTIAKAAELVDDLTLDNLNHKVPPKEQFVTCMSMTELGSYFLQFANWTEEQIHHFCRVWMAFHFVPGNLDGLIFYQGASSCEQPKWKLSDTDIKSMRYLCLPGNDFIGTIVNDLRRWRDSPNFLHLIGMRMHTLADSWAHQRFLGVPNLSSDDLIPDFGVQILQNGSWKKATLNQNEKMVIHDNLEQLKFATTPPGVFPTNESWASIAYLGHARIGSIADYGCLTFRYIPFFQSESQAPEVVRNNAEIFSDAFDQMVQAMACARQNVPFDPKHSPQKRDPEILGVLQTYQLEQSNAWNRLLRKRYGYALPPCQITEWIDAHGHGDPNYRLFVQGAQEQVRLFWEAFPALR